MNMAIITARGGSKRIPRKNIRPFLGKPIIAYSIEAALNSKIFDEVMVSTEDKEIAQLAQHLGAAVPFMRSPETADDFATTADVLEEVITTYRSRGIDYETGCCLYPTAPFVSASLLKEAYSHFEKTGCSTLFPVVRYAYPIQRGLWLRDGKPEMIQPEHLRSRSQDLETAYHDAGQFYFFRIKDFKRQRTMYSTQSRAIVISERAVQDIDTEEDWSIAEMKYRLLYGV